VKAGLTDGRRRFGPLPVRDFLRLSGFTPYGLTESDTIIQLPTLPQQFLSHNLLVVGIHGEHLNRHSSDRGSPHQIGTLPLEMLRPPVQSRMKESDQLPRVRIHTGDIGAFVAVAMGTGQREITIHRRTPVFFGQNMVELKRERKGGLRQSTILTLFSGSFANQSNQFPRHCGRDEEPVCFKNWRALDCMTARRLPTCK